jgi:hypothetical protein
VVIGVLAQAAPSEPVHRRHLANDEEHQPEALREAAAVQADRARKGTV